MIKTIILYFYELNYNEHHIASFISKGVHDLFSFRRYSYIVPISKGTVGINRPLNCEDFRSIAISPKISKVFQCLCTLCTMS